MWILLYPHLQPQNEQSYTVGIDVRYIILELLFSSTISSGGISRRRSSYSESYMIRQTRNEKGSFRRNENSQRKWFTHPSIYIKQDEFSVQRNHESEKQVVNQLILCVRRVQIRRLGEGLSAFLDSGVQSLLGNTDHSKMYIILKKNVGKAYRTTIL